MFILWRKSNSNRLRWKELLNPVHKFLLSKSTTNYMVFTLKDIFFLLAELIISIITGILWFLNILNTKTLWIILSSLIGSLILLGIIVSFQRKLDNFSESNRSHELRIKSLEENFKISERLNKLELEVFNAKKRSN